MTRRMLAALVALVGLFVAAYLWMFKAGVIGTLACGTGSCETVQLSKWATFLNFPVAAWGVAFYAAVLALAIAGLQEEWTDSRPIALAMLVVTGWGTIFSAWLTYLELAVIHAVCRWCVFSAVLTVVLLALAIWDYRELGVGRRELGVD